MFGSTIAALIVFGVVVVAIFIRDGTKYSPESLTRLWATRRAVASIILWLAGGLLFGVIHTRHDVFWWSTAPGAFRAVAAIVLVWLVFRDEF